VSEEDQSEVSDTEQQGDGVARIADARGRRATNLLRIVVSVR
jgi:hypothetical protein